MSYKFLLQDLQETPISIGTDKGLAKIGDALVNLSYSIAKSVNISKYNDRKKIIRTGTKVSKEILSNALKQANMKYFAKKRANAHDMANTVEAIFAYLWLKKSISLDEIMSFLSQHLKGNLSNRKEEINSAINAFKLLLLHVKPLLPPNNT
ncbi:MAG: ribonuclease III family protein [Promethearchaeota archaeon]